MISPHTKPGTEVVAIVTAGKMDGLPGVVKGCIYTVDEIFEANPGQGEKFGLFVREHGAGERIEGRPWWRFWSKPDSITTGYRLSWFRYLDLAGLDALLDVKEKEPA